MKKYPVDTHSQDQVAQLQGQLEALRKKLSEMDAIIRAKSEWEAAFDSVPSMVILTGGDGEILRCNESTIRYLQTAYPVVLGRKIHDVLLGGDETLCLQGEMQLPSIEGWFDVACFPQVREGVTVRNVYILRDITLRKHMESELVEAQKMAALGTMAAGVGHEINSPLQVITVAADRLLRWLDDDKVEKQQYKKDLQAISRNAWRVADIVRSLLIYARVSNGELKREDLNQVVRDCLLLMEHRLKSWVGIKIKPRLAAGPLHFYCESERITQALIHLLDNAHDAMPHGGEITINTRFEKKKQRIVLEVSNNGISIPDEIKSRIFDPFFTNKPLGQGSGLGLSMVMGIVKSHGGDIEVRSGEGQGAAFILSFPLTPPDFSRAASGTQSKGRFDT